MLGLVSGIFDPFLVIDAIDAINGINATNPRRRARDDGG